MVTPGNDKGSHLSGEKTKKVGEPDLQETELDSHPGLGRSINYQLWPMDLTLVCSHLD